MRKSTLAAGVSVLALAATLVTAPAHAHGDRDREPDVVVAGLAGPLSLAVSDRGNVYLTQSFASTLSKVDRHGQVTDLHRLEGSPEFAFLDGVDYHRGSTYHIETDNTPGSQTSHIVRTSKNGTRTVVSDDLWAYERENNPDASKTYGFRGLAATCAAELATFEEAVGFPVFSERGGIEESNPYQLDVHHQKIYVADAAANAILKVDQRTGDISTVAVLPATTITFTAELEAYTEGQLGGADLPDCLVGNRFRPEPVPTDVQVGKHGKLYVTTLQGAVGEGFPLSKVYRVNPRTGSVKEVAGGLHGATGLALTRSGNIVVAEMFGGEVSLVRPGHHRRVVTLFAAHSPADVDVRGRTLYATTGVFDQANGGALVTYRLPRGR